MPSFDIVSNVDLQEVDNAVNNTRKEITTRYDFRKSETEITLDKKEKVIHILTEDHMKMDTIRDIFMGNCVKRKVDLKSFIYEEIKPTSHAMVKREVKLKEGIEKETAQKIVKLIKETKLKVQASIQDEQVRVNGKKIDDLQAIIALLRSQDLDVPLQYVNMKS